MLLLFSMHQDEVTEQLYNKMNEVIAILLIFIVYRFASDWSSSTISTSIRELINYIGRDGLKEEVYEIK